MHKRYILVVLVILVVSFLIWKISGTYALYNQGFEVSLPKPDSSLSFEFEIENMGKLEAELDALTLNGLSILDSEYINYEIIPLDYLSIKTEENDGSILKQNEKHRFRIIVNYQENVNEKNIKETTLNLGSTIIYEEK